MNQKSKLDVVVLSLITMGHWPLQAQQPTTIRLTGTVASTDIHIIKCELEGQSTIESIVEEGTKVKGPTDYRLKAGDTLRSIVGEHDKDELSIRQLNEGFGLDWDKLPAGRMIRIPGDLLIKLDPLNLQERINSQEISVLKTENESARAKGNLEIVKLENTLEMKIAENARQLVELNLNHFKQNEMKTVLEDLQGQVQVAKAKIHGAEKILKLDAKDDPAIQVEIINAQAALLDAQRTLKLTEANLKQFQEHHAPQKIAKLELTSDMALVEIQKIKVKNAADLRDAASNFSTQEKTMELEKEKFHNLQEQMANIRIYAPDEGSVVYCSESSRYGRSSSEPITDGASVRRGQNLIKLPKTDSFKVELSIPQSRRAMVRRGQRAFIIVEGYPNRKIEGVLSWLATTVDTSQRSFSNLSGFKGEIQITNPLETIFEGMIARVEIIVDPPTPTGGNRRPTNLTAPPNSAGSESSQKTKTSGRPNASSRTSMLMRYDKNKDGKVSATEYGEIPERARQFMGDFEKHDTNRDGFIDTKEETAWREKLMERFRQGGAGAGSSGKASPKKESP